MNNLRAALEQLDEALDRLEDAVGALPPAADEFSATPQTASKPDIDRTEIARRLDQVIVDVQGFLDLGLDQAA